MTNWWKRRSLKLRLALWHAAATAVVLAAFAGFVYARVGQRLAAELDRQLRIEFDILEGQLEADAAGGIHLHLQGAHGNEGYARLWIWFEVWSEDQRLLLRRWPVPDAQIKRPVPPPAAAGLSFRTVELEEGLFVRLMQRPARIGDRGVIIRVFRDQSTLRRTLSEIVEIFALGLPLAVLLASVGGYLIARRSLQPVADMAERARQITSESLDERLPNPNPHDELGQLAGVFNQTLHRLEQSFAELKRFTADASHELRTPLTALRTVGEVALRQAADPAALRETIESMLEEAQHFQDLIDALLTLARMEGGKLPVQSKPVDLARLTAEVREHLAVLAAEKEQTIDLENDAGPPVNADPLLLRLALLNIVHNAIRYAPSRTRITLRGRRRAGHVVIEIADAGPGLAPEHQARIFDRFYRVDKARSREAGGYGLGLSIAKWAIEHQGGRIEVESQPGQGSRFQVVLPA